MSKVLSVCLENLQKLPVQKQRCVAAIVGAQVADAATRPLHWVYKQEVLDAALKTVEFPEFFTESKCPFYEVPLGNTSNYNDIVRCTLRYLHSNSGGFSKTGLCTAFKDTFGDGTVYAKVIKERSNMPVQGPWIQSGVKKMIDDFVAGTELSDINNNEYDGLLAALPLILSIDAESPELWNRLKEIVLMFTADSDVIRLFHADAVLLQECLTGSTDPFTSMKDKINSFHPDVLEKIQNVEANRGDDFIGTCAKNGKACSLPGSFLGSYLAMLKTSSFTDAVRLNMTGGGDNCSRANVIGACYGALYGIEGIPKEWMEKVTGIEETIQMAVNVASR